MKITVPMPPSINRTYKTGRGKFYRSRESHDWEEEALMTILTKKPEKFTGKVAVSIIMYFQKDSDIDSRIKALLDILEKSHIVDNDIHVIELSVIKDMDIQKPRVEIEVLSAE